MGRRWGSEKEEQQSADDLEGVMREEHADLAGRLRKLGKPEARVGFDVDGLKLVHAEEAKAAGHMGLARKLHLEVGD
jgi:hypothetical protein